LNELDIESWLRRAHLRTNFADYLVDTATAIRLELDRDVAGVRLRHRREAQLQAGSARRALDFRRRAQNRLDVTHHAIGLLQRAARRHDVIQHEPTFVERREQIAAKRPIAHIGRDYEHDAQREEDDWMMERAAHGALIQHEDSAEQPARE